MLLRTPAQPAASRSLRWAGWLLGQVAVVLAAVTAYFGVRGLTEGSPEQAVRNAERLLALQELLGIAWEEPIQRLVIGSDPVVTLANWVYIYGHWPVIAVVLLWLAIRHRAVFRRARNAMLLSGGVGLVCFAALPMAPPRLAGLDIVDTITERSASYRVLQPPAFTNQYAAMPSLHVGWNLLIGLAILAATTHLVLRILAVAMPVAMNISVVVTANHFLLDMVVGAGLAAGAWLFAGWWQRRCPAGTRPSAAGGS